MVERWWKIKGYCNPKGLGRNEPLRKSLDWLDVAKGIGIILVVIGWHQVSMIARRSFDILRNKVREVLFLEKQAATQIDDGRMYDACSSVYHRDPIFIKKQKFKA